MSVALNEIIEEQKEKEVKYFKENGVFVCLECGRKEVNQNTMFYHVAGHTGVKNYCCPVEGCGKSFVQKSGLTQHMTHVHPAPKPEGATNPFACPFCEHDSAKTKANLLIHIGRKHGVEWIPELTKSGRCEKCDSIQSSNTAYAYHAITCYIEDAPEDVRDLLIERGLVKIKGSKK
jgi:hypothetical protein